MLTTKELVAHKQRTIMKILIALLILCVSIQASTIADHTADFESLSVYQIENAKDNYRMFYGHTSHGNQIIAGMNILRLQDSLYNFHNCVETLPGVFNYDEISSDLCGYMDFWWMNQTRTRLNQPDCDRNIVMWSFCGGMSWQTEAGVAALCDSMSQLEIEYPDIIFIYQTGHLDGTGSTGNLWQRNDQLRDFCIKNNKVLFDFADIESYDPNGVFYPNGSDVCEWCTD